MLFGSTSISATLNRMMDYFFNPDRAILLGTLIDDMIVYTRSEQKHQGHFTVKSE